jgi:hypothetical protein
MLGHDFDPAIVGAWKENWRNGTSNSILMSLETYDSAKNFLSKVHPYMVCVERIVKLDTDSNSVIYLRRVFLHKYDDFIMMKLMFS